MMENRELKLPSEATAALAEGKKIEAIKIIRENCGVGLKEAKDMAEAYIASRPELRAHYETLNAEGMRSLLRWGVLLAAVASAAYWVLGRK